jgi:hypothetical protein
MEYRGQDKKWRAAGGGGLGKGPELVLPNPKLKLMDQVREVLRVKHSCEPTAKPRLKAEVEWLCFSL